MELVVKRGAVAGLQVKVFDTGDNTGAILMSEVVLPYHGNLFAVFKKLILPNLLRNEIDLIWRLCVNFKQVKQHVLHFKRRRLSRCHHREGPRVSVRVRRENCEFRMLKAGTVKLGLEEFCKENTKILSGNQIGEFANMASVTDCPWEFAGSEFDLALHVVFPVQKVFELLALVKRGVLHFAFDL